jgi:L-fuconolactonase
MTAQWRAQVVEEIVEPEIEIIDPHHHLWPKSLGIFGVYDLVELQEDTGGGHRVVGTVFVECSAAYDNEAPEHLRSVGETRYVADRAEASAHNGGAEILAIVSATDLRFGTLLDEALDAHTSAGRGRFRGIRQRLACDASIEGHGHDADPTLMGDPAFRAGIRRLGERGLVFDAWLYHTQLEELLDVVRGTPGTKFVLDHVGGPIGIGPYMDRAEQRGLWHPRLAALAACDNVVLKVGGIGMTTYGAGWEDRSLPPTSDELVAYWGDDVRFCVDTFGPSRCMFESNFPVDRLSCSYHVLWNAFKKMSVSYSATERADLFAETARRTYLIDGPATAA